MAAAPQAACWGSADTCDVARHCPPATWRAQRPSLPSWGERGGPRAPRKGGQTKAPRGAQRRPERVSPVGSEAADAVAPCAPPPGPQGCKTGLGHLRPCGVGAGSTSAAGRPVRALAGTPDTQCSPQSAWPVQPWGDRAAPGRRSPPRGASPPWNMATAPGVGPQDPLPAGLPRPPGPTPLRRPRAAAQRQTPERGPLPG